MAVGCEIGGYGDCVAGFRGGGGLDEPRVGVGHGCLLLRVICVAV